MENEQPSYTIRAFCKLENISGPTYYKLKRLGLAPKEMRNGGLVRISHRARMDYQRNMELQNDAEAEVLRERARKAARKSVASPDHVSKRRSA